MLGAAVTAAVFLAGCGGGADRPAPVRPALPAPLAAQLAERSDRVAAALASGNSCSAVAEANALQQATVQAINRRQVPAAFQEELSAAVNDLAGRIPCVPPPQQDEQEHGKRGEGKDKDKGKGKHGKGD